MASIIRFFWSTFPKNFLRLILEFLLYFNFYPFKKLKPPVSAFHSDSTSNTNKWKFYGSVNPKIKFWGKSIEVTPKGTLTLELEG